MEWITSLPTMSFVSSTKRSSVSPSKGLPNSFLVSYEDLICLANATTRLDLFLMFDIRTLALLLLDAFFRLFNFFRTLVIYGSATI